MPSSRFTWLASAVTADDPRISPFLGFGDEEFYPTVEAEAAAMLFGLARNHAFIDGNERIALLSTLQFLNVNGFNLDLSSAEDAASRTL